MINTTLTHGERIAHELQNFIFEFDERRYELKKSYRKEISSLINVREQPFITNGVNFSRFNSFALSKKMITRRKIEVEALGPYLASYINQGGRISIQNIIQEDFVGLQLTGLLKKFFPTARIVSLIDDYNTSSPGKLSVVSSFSFEDSIIFQESLVNLYQQFDILPLTSRKEIDYLMISESAMTKAAERLVKKLERKGNIIRKGEEIIFINRNAENPLYRAITLRTKKSKWLCEALDAATFLKKENLNIIHIVALPNYMKSQQDKVWEILRVIGIQPQFYHNIFYDCNVDPETIVRTVKNQLEKDIPCR
jgi:hypothetical protein